MNANFEELKDIILTDDDMFIVQDKETGFKQKLTKAQLAAAIGGGGGGGGELAVTLSFLPDRNIGDDLLMVLADIEEHTIDWETEAYDIGIRMQMQPHTAPNYNQAWLIGYEELKQVGMITPGVDHDNWNSGDWGGVSAGMQKSGAGAYVDVSNAQTIASNISSATAIVSNHLIMRKHSQQVTSNRREISGGLEWVQCDGGAVSRIPRRHMNGWCNWSAPGSLVDALPQRQLAIVIYNSGEDGATFPGFEHIAFTVKKVSI